MTRDKSKSRGWLFFESMENEPQHDSQNFFFLKDVDPRDVCKMMRDKSKSRIWLFFECMTNEPQHDS